MKVKKLELPEAQKMAAFAIRVRRNIDFPLGTLLLDASMGVGDIEPILIRMFQIGLAEWCEAMSEQLS